MIKEKFTGKLYYFITDGGINNLSTQGQPLLLGETEGSLKEREKERDEERDRVRETINFAFQPF